jgi:hypothetical protein
VDKFNLDLNAKALVEQDPEFKEYAKDALLELFLSNKNTLPMIGALHGFYQTGMTQQQVAQWFKSVGLFNPTQGPDNG